jgi:hypothetical protein
MTVLDEEIIAWTSVADALPDADTTVLVHAREADEPVALGYFDGHSWFEYSGMEYGNEDEIAAEVTAWAPMPRGPERT